MAHEPVGRRRIETNHRCSKIISPVICLATGALLLVLIVGSMPAKIAGGAQSTASKPPGAQKTAEPGDARFTCPDPLAAEACKSFEELYKAGDEGVRPLFNNGTAYVCFGQGSDEFFIVELNNASFHPMHLDPQTRRLVPDDDATARGWGHINAFAHGVQDASILPIFFFNGIWLPLGPTFNATKINQQDILDSNHFGVALDPQQFNAAWRYKNRADKDIDYRLVIQRSTGRFSESFTEESSKFPFLERNGRCSRLPLTEPKGRRGRK